MELAKEKFSINPQQKCVKDLLSGLEWKIEVEDECSFNQACTRYSKEDHDGWRMPTLSELNTLVDEEWPFDVLDDHADMFWSSNQNFQDQSLAHYVEFNGGFTNTADKSTYGCVRLVRIAKE